MKIGIVRIERIETTWEIEVPDTLVGPELQTEVLKQIQTADPSDVDHDDEPMFEVYVLGPEGDWNQDDPMLEW